MIAKCDVCRTRHDSSCMRWFYGCIMCLECFQMRQAMKEEERREAESLALDPARKAERDMTIRFMRAFFTSPSISAAAANKLADAIERLEHHK